MHHTPAWAAPRRRRRCQCARTRATETTRKERSGSRHAGDCYLQERVIGLAAGQTAARTLVGTAAGAPGRHETSHKEAGKKARGRHIQLCIMGSMREKRTRERSLNRGGVRNVAKGLFISMRHLSQLRESAGGHRAIHQQQPRLPAGGGCPAVHTSTRPHTRRTNRPNRPEASWINDNKSPGLRRTVPVCTETGHCR